MIPVIAGVDPSLTGTAVAVPGLTKLIRTTGTGMGRLAYIRTAVHTLVVMAAVAERAEVRVVIEGYSYATTHSAHVLGELGGVLRVMLWENHIPWLDVAPATLKRYATGKGNAKKIDMVIAARDRLGYEGNNDNEADALWLRALGMDMLGEPLVKMPASHRIAIKPDMEWERAA